jgi:hypothetical protein
MAAMTHYHQLIETLHNRVKLQAGEIRCLADALAREDQYLARKGQADLLAALRARITREVEATRLAEDRAYSDFSWEKKSKASAHRIVGIGFALFSHNGRAVQRNLDLAKAELSRTAPFGTVAIQIAPPGVPDGVTTVCVSRLARQIWTSEQDIGIRLEARGCRLIEPAVLVEVLKRLEQDALKGSVALPLTCEQFGVYLASRGPRAVKRLAPGIRVLAPAAPRRLLLGGPPSSTPGDNAPPG